MTAPTTHACPPGGSGLTPCCGRTPLELPADQAITTAPTTVTCKGRTLTADELQPFALAIARSETTHEAQPHPPCPACNAQVTSIVTVNDPVIDPTLTRVQLRPCHHFFTIAEETAGDVNRQAVLVAWHEKDHADRKEAKERAEQDDEPDAFVVALRADDGELIVGIHPDGSITQGPMYEPDAAAAEFWQALTRAAQAANPLGGGQ